MLSMAEAPTAEELERADALKRLARGSLWRRVPISSVRLELGDLAGEWVVLAVPTMRVIATFEFKSVAQFVFDELASLLEAQRRDFTRPYGTCPACSTALMQSPREELRSRKSAWCPSCGKYVTPAGSREGTT